MNVLALSRPGKRNRLLVESGPTSIASLAAGKGQPPEQEEDSPSSSRWVPSSPDDRELPPSPPVVEAGGLASRQAQQVNRQVHQARRRLTEMVETLGQLDQILSQLKPEENTKQQQELDAVQQQMQSVGQQAEQLQQGLEKPITDWLHHLAAPETAIQQADSAEQIVEWLQTQIFAHSRQAIEAQVTGISQSGLPRQQV